MCLNLIQTSILSRDSFSAMPPRGRKPLLNLRVRGRRQNRGRRRRGRGPRGGSFQLANKQIQFPHGLLQFNRPRPRRRRRDAPHDALRRGDVDLRRRCLRAARRCRVSWRFGLRPAYGRRGGRALRLRPAARRPRDRRGKGQRRRRRRHGRRRVFQLRGRGRRRRGVELQGPGGALARDDGVSDAVAALGRAD